MDSYGCKIEIEMCFDFTACYGLLHGIFINSLASVRMRF